MDRERVDPAVVILDAALESIYTSKISGARLRQVARQAGMSQGNLHYYYPTKEDLYSSLLDRLLQIFVEERQSILGDESIDPRAKLRYFFEQQIRLIERRKEVVIFFDFWVQGTADAETRSKIAGMYQKWREDVRLVIDQGIRSGVFSPRFAGQVPALLASLLDGASLQYLTDSAAIDLPAYFQAAEQMLLSILEAG
jgi:AcrR family transcriptional regulator